MCPQLTPFLAVRLLARRLNENDSDYDEVLELGEGRNYILLGEATHGTREFYRMRADITRLLILRGEVDAIAIEGDWPDVWRVNRFVLGEGGDDAESALDDFQRFPAWMWRNREMLAFVAWLRAHNTTLPVAARVGVYGLDLYSLYRSADAVIRYLEQIDPDQAELARAHYAALDHVREPQTYGYEAATGRRRSARDGAIAQLLKLREDDAEHLSRDGLSAMDAHFFAEQNAQVVVNAEHYYRAMFERRINTWNLRDAHMAQTLFAISRHRLRQGGAGRVVVWAHNSHVGDARATETHTHGEWNLGQLVRQEAGADALLVGFTTYTGHVCAASAWDAAPEQKWVRPALRDSCEALFHASGLDRFYLPLDTPSAAELRMPMLQRAIGVLYLPESERASHYFAAAVANQFDAIFHVDETSAVEPLAPPLGWHQPEATQAIECELAPRAQSTDADQGVPSTRN
ncbi:erythromycin esterase family protein [Cupriavidus basilensis]